MINIQQNLLLAFGQNISRLGLSDPLVWSQFLVVALALMLGYLVKWHMKERICALLEANKKPSWQRKWIPLIFPLCALLIVWIGCSILHVQYPRLYLLNLVSALLWALLVLRVMLRLIEIAFGARTWAKQTERWMIWTVWFLFALYVTGLSEPIIDLLDSLTFHYGKTTISLWGIAQTILVVVATLFVALILSYLIEARLLRSVTDNPSMRLVVARLTKAFFVILAFMIALPLVGIDLTVLSVFGGALGVGLGFGLQKIASNYVSGFTLLLDRSLRIGDMVKIGNDQGQVEGLTARYIILKALDGTVALIPNDVLLSSVVINKTYTDKNVRVSVPVQVTYSSDLKLAMQLMLDATKSIARILQEPIPNVALKGFADSGIDLELGFWIEDEENGMGLLRSEVNMRIWESFNAQGIEFSYPHRDIRIVDLPNSMEQFLQKKKMPIPNDNH